MRLIDADELTFDRLTDSICQGQAEDVVAEAPTIEAVPVVRCGECKHYDEDGWGYGGCQRPSVNYLRTADNNFCSYGERRADEPNT